MLQLYDKFGRFIPLNGKIPITKNWRHENTSWPTAKRRIKLGGNVGFVIPENMIVIDVDPRNGGEDSYRRLLRDTGLPELCNSYPCVLTGGKGLHIYGRITRSHEKIAVHNPQYPGIDIKKFGGYVVTAGSKHESGNKYDVLLDVLPPVFYNGLLDVFSRQSRGRPINDNNQSAEWTPEQLAAHLALLPIEQYRSNDAWFTILAAAHTATRGAGLPEFLKWSLSDPEYADHGNQISARWASLHAVDNPRTAATICAQIDPSRLSAARLSGILDDLDSTPATIPDAPVLPDQSDLDKLIGGYNDESDIPHQIARMVLRYHNIISASDGRFWEFEKTHWKPIHTNLVSNYVYRAYSDMHEGKSVSSILSATIGVISAITAAPHTPGSTHLEGYSIINVKNGELWLDDLTGEEFLYPHDPNSNQINVLPITYDPTAAAPRFAQFLNEVFLEKSAIEKREIIRHLLEVLGYTLQARKNIATWVLLHGRGANGKTVLLSILSALLGDAALERPIGSISTDKNNHALASLPGKLALIDDDVSFNTILPDGEIKSLSENKWMEANPKNATPYRFRSCVIPILSANSWPVTRDLSDGLKRRAQVFQFTRTFLPMEQDVTLTDYITKNELSGVLNLCLAGLRRVRARGVFDAPKSCLAARDLWYSANNQTVNYVQTRLQNTASLKLLPLKDLWTDYQGYCLDEGIRKQMTRQQFRYSLESAGVTILMHKGAVCARGVKLRRKTPN
jgi:P4 family phage/plasmid primase-like protien